MESTLAAKLRGFYSLEVWLGDKVWSLSSKQPSVITKPNDASLTLSVREGRSVTSQLYGYLVTTAAHSYYF